MANNFERVDEYKRISSAGVARIETTGHGMRVYPDKVTWIYQAGIGYDGGNDHNVFTVYLANGRNFITDWSGIQTIGEFVRVNEYARIKQEDGSTILQYTDHGIRVNPAQVVNIYTRGLGYELDGETTHECFRVQLIGGASFVTDWNGIQDIQNYGA